MGPRRDDDDDFAGDAHRKDGKKRAKGKDRAARAATPAAGEDYYARVAIDALVRVLRDGSLAAHHAAVTQALMFIFQSLGLRCVPFLGNIVPHLLDVARTCEPGLRESVLLQLAALAAIVRHHLRDWLPRIFELVVDYWAEHLEQVVPLLEEIATSVSEHLAALVPRALPLLLASLAPPFEGGGRAPWDGKRAEKKDDAKGSAPAGKPPRSRAVSLKDDGYGVGGLDDEPPLLTKAKALTAPAALSETRLALILRATMLLRGALSDYLFLVVPALLKLADALGGAGAAESRAQSLLSWADHPESPGRHDFDDGGDAHSPRTVGHFSASYKKVVAPGNVSFADLAETGGAAAASAENGGQRPFSTPALGPQWQARVVRCLRVVVGRRALARRRDLGARIARSLCRLLERSDVVAADAAPAKAAHGEALRDAARDALEVVRDQLGEELFAPFVGLATRCLSLGPRGAASPAALAWAKRDARTRPGGDDDDRAADGDGGEGHAFLSLSLIHI